MTIERYLRAIAGFMLLISLGLTQFLHPDWVYFTLFIALNLLQSSATNWCPVMTLLKKLGVKQTC